MKTTKTATPAAKTAVAASATPPARKRNAKAKPAEAMVTATEAPVAPVVKAPAAPPPTSTIASHVENRPVVAPKAAPQATYPVVTQVQDRPVAAPKAAFQASRRREITSDLIAARAYTIWEQQGRPQGRERENWLLAESQLKQEIQSFAA